MTIGVVGLGMIGGSLAAALSAAGFCVRGFDISYDVQKVALERGYIRSEISDFSALDVLVVALTEEATKTALKEYAPRLRDGAIVLDICGNKRGVADCMRDLKRKFPRLNFVGTHPMAGRETDGKQPGIFKASPKLFEGAYAVLVPISEDGEAVDVASKLYGAVGVRGVSVCDAETHDKMISYTSQLAHILSSAYARSEKAKDHRGFSAGSFLDLTRVARLDARMWTELFLNNDDMLLADMDGLIDRLREYRDAIADGDGQRLQALLEDGNVHKDAADRSSGAKRRTDEEN